MPSRGAQIIEARLVYDAANDCVLVEVNDVVRHAVWPAGYGWNREQSGIQSPDAKELALIGPPVRLIAFGTGTIKIHSVGLGPGASSIPPPDTTCNPNGDALVVVGIA